MLIGQNAKEANKMEMTSEYKITVLCAHTHTLSFSLLLAVYARLTVVVWLGFTVCSRTTVHARLHWQAKLEERIKKGDTKYSI